MIKRTLLMLLCCILAMGIFVGCGEDEKATETELAFDGPVIATINGEDVTVDEFNYYFMMAMYSDEMYSGAEVTDDYWTAEKIEELMKTSLDEITSSRVYKIAAEKYDIEISDDDLKLIDDNIESGVDYYGSEENFDLYFASQGIDREFFRELSIINYYATNLYNKYAEENASEEAILQTFMKDYVKAKHILITNTDESGADVSAEAYSKVEDIKAQLDSGADFDTLMNEYNQDPGMASAPDGYVFTHGEMVTEFENAAFALEVGQISDIVETSYGYHIIKKEELTAADLDNTTTDMYGNSSSYRDIVKSAAVSEDFNSYMEEQKANVKVDIVQDEYDKVAAGAVTSYAEYKIKVDEAARKLSEIMSANAGTTDPAEETVTE